MNNTLKHVAIIMDGNGRWASSKGLPRKMGHKAGAKNLLDLSIYIINKGVKYLSLYAFSTENFKRNKEEVEYIMNLFIEWFNKEAVKYKKENIKIVFSGRKEPLDIKVWDAMKTLEKETCNNTKGVLNICLNYGGHAEIIDATLKISDDILNNKIKPEDVTEELYNKYLYNELPPIDFLIRTSGEIRISNFMLYQIAYAEMYFPSVYFPAFDKKEFDKAIVEYNKRIRRFGDIK